jgi:ubiquinone/menaquinone biosynthesis C-methylase UbiE
MRPQPQQAWALVAGLAIVMTASGGWAQRPAADPEINQPFQNPDVAEYIKRFETDTREVYARREAIVRALGLKPGMVVADLGAGTGLFTRLIAERVGTGGRVYAVDIAPAFLTHIAQEARRRGHAQVQTVRGTQDSTGLPPGAIDLVFVCDVYHHLEHPGKVLASIHRCLRPGGQLVVVDFDRVEGRSSAFVLKHVRAAKAVFVSEIEAAGFERLKTTEAPALKENFFLRFGKRAPARAVEGPKQRPARAAAAVR